MVVLEQSSSGMTDGDHSEQHELAADSQMLFPFFSLENRATLWGTWALIAVTALPDVLHPISSGQVAREPATAARAWPYPLMVGLLCWQRWIYKRTGKTLSSRPGG